MKSSMSENCISLVDQLCSTYTDSPSVLKKFNTLALSELFKNHVKVKEETNPMSLIKIDILSHLLLCPKKERRVAEQNIKSGLNRVQNLIDTMDLDYLNSIFLFLHCLANSETSISRSEEKPSSVLKYSEDLFSGVLNGCTKFEDRISWGRIYEPQSLANASWKYPIFEPPGTGLKYMDTVHTHFLSSYTRDVFNGKQKMWRFDMNKPVDVTAPDEGISIGYLESDEDQSNVCTDTCSSISTEYEFNDLSCLQFGRRCWENLGNGIPKQEPPFASENVESIVHLWRVSNCNKKTRTLSTPIGVLVLQKQLINDIKYLLFGMESSSFYYDKDLATFYIRHRLHTKSLSPDFLECYCKSFITCANHFRALKKFAEARLKLKFGVIHHEFCKSIICILNAYKKKLLRIKWGSMVSLLEIEDAVSPLRIKLSFLVKLCLIENVNCDNQFPSGVQLLDYVYDSVMKVFRKDLKLMMVYIFENCCNAYFRILYEWIFSGCFFNVEFYKEFFVEFRSEYEMCRDSRRIKCLTINEDRIPKLVEQYCEDLFRCGQSVNLLKIFSKKDNLHEIIQKNSPRMVCVFNKVQAEKYANQWFEFKRNRNDCHTPIDIKALFATNNVNVEHMKHVKEERLQQEAYEMQKEVLDAQNTNIVVNVEIKSADIVNKPVRSIENEIDDISCVQNQLKMEYLLDTYKSLNDQLDRDIQSKKDEIMNLQDLESVSCESSVQVRKTAEVVNGNESICSSYDVSEKGITEVCIDDVTKSEALNVGKGSKLEINYDQNTSEVKPEEHIVKVNDINESADEIQEQQLEIVMKPVGNEVPNKMNMTIDIGGGGDAVHVPNLTNGCDLEFKSDQALSSNQCLGAGDNVTELERNRRAMMAGDFSGPSNDLRPIPNSANVYIEELNTDQELESSNQHENTYLGVGAGITELERNRRAMMTGDFSGPSNDLRPIPNSTSACTGELNTDQELESSNQHENTYLGVGAGITELERNRRAMMTGDFSGPSNDLRPIPNSTSACTEELNTDQELESSNQHENKCLGVGDGITELERNRRVMMAGDFNGPNADLKPIRNSKKTYNGLLNTDQRLECSKLGNIYCAGDGVTELERNRRSMMAGDFSGPSTDLKPIRNSNKTYTDQKLESSNQFGNIYCAGDGVTELERNRRSMMVGDFSGPSTGLRPIPNSMKFYNKEVDTDEELGSSNRRGNTYFGAGDVTEMERNRRSMMAGDFSGQSTDVKRSANKNSEAHRNKLKVMSSVYDESTAELKTDRVLEEDSELVKNREKVMFSEYYNRLSEVESEHLSTTEKMLHPAELTDRARNKLKVLGSEYHIHSYDNVKPAIEESDNSDPLKADKLEELCQNHAIENKDNRVTVTSNDESVSPTNEALITPVEHKSVVLRKLDIEFEASQNTVAEDNEKIDNVAVQAEVNLQQCTENIPVGSRDVTSQENTSDTTDVDAITMHQFLPLSISIPLKIQFAFVNDAILQALLLNEGFIDQLKVLKDFMLLNKAEFRLALLNPIFEMGERICDPSMLINYYSLATVLDEALLTCTGNGHLLQYQKKLSFQFENVPSVWDVTNVELFDCFWLSYDVSWPINLLITPKCLQLYRSVFIFLLQIHRVKWCLKQDFITLKDLKKGFGMQYIEVQLYIHNIDHVVSTLQEFISRDILGQCWFDLEKKLTTETVTFEILYHSHEEYIRQIFRRCLLHKEMDECYQDLMNMFRHILKFHQALNAGMWLCNEEFNLLYHTNFKHVQEYFKEFALSFKLFNSKLNIMAERFTYAKPMHLHLSAEIQIIT